MGIRGIPGTHGGFETFVERLAPFLAASGCEVSVYCQEDGSSLPTRHGVSEWYSEWLGVKRIHIAVTADTPLNSIVFDVKCIAHAVKQRPDVVLILGYNTAIFTVRLRMAGIPTVVNMDGMEWSRAKWSALAKTWLYLNERAACWVANHLIADHPQIERHLRTRAPSRKITVIPYGADLLEGDDAADREILQRFGLSSGKFATLIARAEPENSILEMVEAFSAKARGLRLVVLGRYHPDLVAYHAEVVAAASAEVYFAGAIYDKNVVQTLRRHCLFYLHGHQVGGCNPSLLEAMGAGNAVLAHDNRFNRWVVSGGARYFDDAASCEQALETLIADAGLIESCGAANRRRVVEIFNWHEVLRSYAELLSAMNPAVAKNEDCGWGRRPVWSLDADVSI